jgi:hypothetical protein
VLEATPRPVQGYQEAREAPQSRRASSRR